MFDATSKIPAGIMNANINWMGSYKMCNKIYKETANKSSPIRGRYCNTVIGSPVITEGAVIYMYFICTFFVLLYNAK